MLDSEQNKPLSAYFKVPFRQCYCLTFWQCVKYTLYCHIWLRINPPKLSNTGPKGK